MEKQAVELIAIEDILNEDELRMFKPALDSVRKHGFGQVSLLLRNGYIYNIKVTTEYHNSGNGKRSKE